MGFKSKKRSVVGETIVHGLSGLSEAASAYLELASSASEYQKDTILASECSNERRVKENKQSGLLVLIVVKSRVALPSRSNTLLRPSIISRICTIRPLYPIWPSRAWWHVRVIKFITESLPPGLDPSSHNFVAKNPYKHLCSAGLFRVLCGRILIRLHRPSCENLCDKRDSRAPILHAFVLDWAGQHQITNMAASGKAKANGRASGKVATSHAEEAHGYEFLGP